MHNFTAHSSIIIYKISFFYLLCSLYVYGMEKETFEDILTQAIINHDIDRVKALSKSEHFDTQLVESTCNFPFLQLAVAPPSLEKMEPYINAYQTCETKEEKDKVLNEAFDITKACNLIEFLLEKKVDPNIHPCKRFPPFERPKGGKPTKYCLCLEKRPFLPLRAVLDSYYWTPFRATKESDENQLNFYMALYQKVVKPMVMVLLKGGADPNNEGGVDPKYWCHKLDKKVAHRAAHCVEDPEVVTQLLFHGADFGMQTNEGNTVVHELVVHGRLDVCNSIFSCIPTDRDMQCAMTLFLIKKHKKEYNISKVVLHNILEKLFGEKWTVMRLHKNKTLNQLLKMCNNPYSSVSKGTPHELIKFFYERLKNKNEFYIDLGMYQIGGDTYKLGFKLYDHTSLCELYQKLIDITDPQKYL